MLPWNPSPWDEPTGVVEYVRRSARASSGGQGLGRRQLEVEQALQRQDIAGSKRRTGLGNCRLDLRVARVASRDAGQHPLVVVDERQHAAGGAMPDLPRRARPLVQVFANQLDRRGQRLGECDAVQVARVVVIEVGQVVARLQRFEVVERQARRRRVGRRGRRRLFGRARDLDVLAAFQMVQLEQQCVGMRAVIDRQVGAHRQDLLRHQTQFVNDGALGTALDAVEDFGDVKHDGSLSGKGVPLRARAGQGGRTRLGRGKVGQAPRGRWKPGTAARLTWPCGTALASGSQVAAGG